MAPLATNLRRDLERAIVEARKAAERGARSALGALTVREPKAGAHLDAAGKAIRNRLRAHARQVGDKRSAKGEQATDRLEREIAYEHWHRMLFARFLAENDLLIEPESGVSVSLDDVEELAREQGVKPWPLAASHAQRMLPQIFHADDPALAIELPTETALKLESLLENLPRDVFISDDALGWTYQFWQAAEKKAVNDRVSSGEKVTGETLPAVTQLFTEHYMVLFLLHNTIGAWHAGKTLTDAQREGAGSEQTLRDAVRLAPLGGYHFEYLRFVREPKQGEEPDEGTGAWRPAAGVYQGWPREAKSLRVLDPCCGSGHFLVAAFDLLVRLRTAEEGLDTEAAIRAVLADNLFGLELDQRCTQIAAFNLALAAWKIAGKPIDLPRLNMACSGLGPQATREEWLAMAEGAGEDVWAGISTASREFIRNGLLDLHATFSQAPELGSLIDPVDRTIDLITADYETLRPFLDRILAVESADEEVHERVVAARGMAAAAEIFTGGEEGYTLVITNVPYLGRGSHSALLKAFVDRDYKEAKADLATVFLARMLEWVGRDGTVAAVTPQNWLFLTSYRKLRERLLKERTWNVVARLGPGAFETIGGHVVNVALLALSGDRPAKEAVMAGIDASAARSASDKAAVLRGEGPEGGAAASGYGGNGSGAAVGGVRAGLDGVLEGSEGVFEGSEAILERSETVLERSEIISERSKMISKRSEIVSERSKMNSERSKIVSARSEMISEAPEIVSERSKTLPEASRGAPDGSPAPAAATRRADAAADNGDEDDDTGADPADLAEEAGNAVTADGIVRVVPQAGQLENSEARVIFESGQGSLPPLFTYCGALAGALAGDLPRFGGCYWEVPAATLGEDWELYQTAPRTAMAYGGREMAIFWQKEAGEMYRHAESVKDLNHVAQNWLRGKPNWGKQGVAVGVMATIPATIYTGEIYDCASCALVPDDSSIVPALWEYCLSGNFARELRKLNPAIAVTSKTLVQVPFDLAFWQKVAAEKYPNGLPEPQSNDPTQWLFHGHPAGMLQRGDAREPNPHDVLQVALARLVGYRWPAELDEKMRLAPEARALVNRCADLANFADADGIVCLSPVRGESSAADRLRRLLAAAFGDGEGGWSNARERELLHAAAEAFNKGKAAASLDEWLRERFFAEHCALFHHRPFVWHIWDGRKDGFHALVNYHKLAEGEGRGRKLLDTLTYAYLGDWIKRQEAGVKSGEAGAEARLAAAMELKEQLEQILAGEPPYDIFVRWKPLHEQPAGWSPDINDGVRLNIRPFMSATLSKGRTGAGVLRWKPNIKWTKDRGQEPQRLRPRDDFPWFWGWDEKKAEHAIDFGSGLNGTAPAGREFDGNRWNDPHYTNATKQAARERVARKEGASA